MSCQPRADHTCALRSPTQMSLRPSCSYQASSWPMSRGGDWLKAVSVCSAINVFKSHDVVFTQVRAALNLDHHERIRAGVVQTVLVLGGNVGGFVAGQAEHIFAVGDFRHAADHDPVFV